jgi:hypothetical protein
MPKLTVVGLAILTILFGISVMLNIPDTKQPIAGIILIGVGMVNLVLTIINKHYRWLR